MADTEIFKAEGKKNRLTITPDRITVKVSNRHSKYPIETFLKLANKLPSDVLDISENDHEFISI